jgi:phenylalanyl-tRNA synthetase beta chain
MKVTLNWLKEYTAFDWTPEHLAERLTMMGLEVERLQKISGEFEGVVVAQILSSTQHPNADRLSVCRVADGAGERQIVCGAKNYKVGDKVPLILPGASLPAAPGSADPPFTIKVSKMRGVESQGMLCSPKELGLADEADGLLILAPESRVGQPFAEYLGRASGDVVYDLEITPNRPDWNSVLGIAREISALTGAPLRLPDLDSGAAFPAPGPEPVEQWVAVQLEDAEACPRYIARVIRGVKVGPSPSWLRETLEKVGVRSINNVVDVTNYVMLESGQPLHAFDYHLIARGTSGSPTIVVRRAQAEESFKTLDGQSRRLDASMLLIADAQKAIALAGVMGGENSEITPQTTDVLLESAHFQPQNIRATSKRLDLRTESSYRFERGGDAEICEWASRRAAQLIVQLAGGELLGGAVDRYPQPHPKREISLRFQRTDHLVGVAIDPRTQVDYLRRLQLEIEFTGESVSCQARIPSFRVDLKREVDLIEEIVRLHGIDKIAPTTPRGTIGAHSFDSIHDLLGEVRRLMVASGLNEAQGQTLISSHAAALFGAETKTNGLELRNPLSSDMNILRPSLLPGLIESLRHNVTHKNSRIALFEIGRVFSPQEKALGEQRRLSLALTGERSAPFWAGADRGELYDFHDLKGVLDEFSEQFGLRGLAYQRKEKSDGLYLESALILLGKQVVGEAGQLLPALARRYDLRDPVFLAELDLELLLTRRSAAKSFKVLPSYPAVRRDVALLVPEGTTHDQVLTAIRQAKPDHFESTELFDVFRGAGVPEGRKSMAYALTYRHVERTLTDTEVNAAHEKVLEKLRQLSGASIR